MQSGCSTTTRPPTDTATALESSPHDVAALRCSPGGAAPRDDLQAERHLGQCPRLRRVSPLHHDLALLLYSQQRIANAVTCPASPRAGQHLLLGLKAHGLRVLAQRRALALVKRWSPSIPTRTGLGLVRNVLREMGEQARAIEAWRDRRASSSSTAYASLANPRPSAGAEDRRSCSQLALDACARRSRPARSLPWAPPSSIAMSSRHRSTLCARQWFASRCAVHDPRS